MKVEYVLHFGTVLFIDVDLMQFMIWMEINSYMELYLYLEDPFLFTNIAYVLVI